MPKLKIVNTAKYIRPYKVNGLYYIPESFRKAAEEAEAKEIEPAAPESAPAEPETSPETKVSPEPVASAEPEVSPEPESSAETAEEPEEQHSPAECGYYTMEDRDPHTWMAPLLAQAHAHVIFQTLCALNPTNKEFYLANRKAFEGEIKELHRYLYRVLRPLREKLIVVFHPAFGYFTRAYGLYQLIIEEDGKPPSAKRLAELIDTAKTKGTKVIFVQKQFDHQAAQAIADELGGAIIEVDPLAKDYIANLRQIGEQIAAVLAAQEEAMAETNPEGATPEEIP